jgi:short-subunit dehydrogenase
MNSWIILGATSGMARPFLRKLAEQGNALFLAGRNQEELETLAADCRLRGAPEAQVMRFDARDHSNYADLIVTFTAQGDVLNAAVFSGSMPDQEVIDANPALIEGVMADSYTGPATFLQMLVPHMEARSAGTILGVGSVAGDRGRLGNYVYGAAKAAFATYLSGLRNRAGRKGVHVITVKPGPVDTAMTQGMEMPFMTTPEAVADDLMKAIEKRRNVVYTARIWQVVMTVIRLIPEPIFKKMSI